MAPGLKPDCAGQDNADLLERLYAHRFSCRGFRPDQVPREIIEKILSLAQRTPSWCNTQPWNVIITSGSETSRFSEALRDSEKLGPATPDFPWPREYSGVYQERRRECGLALYESVGVAKGDRAASAKQAAENFRFFGAPHVAIITTEDALGVYGAVDCGGYVNNFMFAARSFGIACIAQAALAAHPAVIRNHFGLPENRLIVCGISFGFENETHAANSFRTTRADLSDVVTWAGD
jgi:nitroreductase